MGWMLLLFQKHNCEIRFVSMNWLPFWFWHLMQRTIINYARSSTFLISTTIKASTLTNSSHSQLFYWLLGAESQWQSMDLAVILRKWLEVYSVWEMEGYRLLRLLNGLKLINQWINYWRAWIQKFLSKRRFQLFFQFQGPRIITILS